MEVGFDVLWLCSFITALAMAVGANAKPMRQPVMAYVFDNDPATNTVDLPLSAEAMENGSLS